MKLFTKSALAALALMLCSNAPLLAQTTTSPILGVLPTTDDHQASPGPDFRRIQHTGTDALSYSIPASVPADYLDGQTMQVMTWDDSDQDFVTVSWDFFDDQPPRTGPNNPVVPPAGAVPAKGSFRIQTQPNGSGLSADPDIVLAYHGDDLYINVVYTSNDLTQYEVYRWDYVSHAFSPAGQRTLGDSRFEHSYPNIDANAEGLIAVTWQQTVTTMVDIRVTSTSNFFPSYSVQQSVTFGRTLVAGGDITGNFRDCYLDRNTGTIGIYVLNPPTGLFEQTLHPDVAISEGNAAAAVISSTFIRHFVDGNGLFSIQNKLSIMQTRFDRCAGEDVPQGPVLVRLELLPDGSYEWDYSNNNTIGVPRIAAPPIDPRNDPDRGYDVEVAVDRTVGTCGAPQYAIWNFGKSEGRFRNEYTLISPAGDPNLILSEEPAISYSVFVPNRLPSRSGASYTISWTGGPEYRNSEDVDVWAVALDKGAFVGNGSSGPSAQPAGYNRVNYQGKGVQQRPSIAGRHLIGNCFGRAAEMTPEELEAAIAAGSTPGGCSPHVHLFADGELGQASYRRTSELAGNGTAYRAAPASSPAMLQAYPNPSNEKVTIRLGLHAGEQVRRLTILDAQGRQVSELSAAAAQQGSAEWQPAAKLPAGLYLVRVETSERTKSLSIVRE